MTPNDPTKGAPAAPAAAPAPVPATSGNIQAAPAPLTPPVIDPQVQKAADMAASLKQNPNPDWPTKPFIEGAVKTAIAADRTKTDEALKEKADLKDLQALGETVARHGIAIAKGPPVAAPAPVKDDSEIKRVRGVVDTILDRMSKSTASPLDREECEGLRTFLRGTNS